LTDLQKQQQPFTDFVDDSRDRLLPEVIEHLNWYLTINAFRFPGHLGWARTWNGVDTLINPHYELTLLINQLINWGLPQYPFITLLHFTANQARKAPYTCYLQIILICQNYLLPSSYRAARSNPDRDRPRNPCISLTHCHACVDDDFTIVACYVTILSQCPPVPVYLWVPYMVAGQSVSHCADIWPFSSVPWLVLIHLPVLLAKFHCRVNCSFSHCQFTVTTAFPISVAQLVKFRYEEDQKWRMFCSHKASMLVLSPSADLDLLSPVLLTAFWLLHYLWNLSRNVMDLHATIKCFFFILHQLT